MTIQYGDGQAVEAVLLARTGNNMRVAIQGADDATEFCQLSGVWVSEEGDPVRIVFAWEQTRKPRAADAECPEEFAARLIHSLFYAPAGNEPGANAAVLALGGTLQSEQFFQLAGQLLHAERLQ